MSKFFNATGDLLLVGDCDANFGPLYRELINLYSNREIDKKLLEESLGRITNLQNQYIESDYETRFLTEISRKAINTNINKKIDFSEITFLIPQGDPLSPSDTSNKDYFEYPNLINNLFDNPKIKTYDLEIGKINEPLEKTELIVSFVVDSYLFKKQLKMQKDIKEFANDVIYIILRDERDLQNYQTEKYVLTQFNKSFINLLCIKNDI